MIDALLATAELIKRDVALQQALAAKLARIDTSRPLILVTGHRRESFGIGIEQICDALKRLAMHHAVEIIYPVHLNPNVDAVVRKRLMKVANVHLLEPLDYVSFVYLMHKARIIVTDSGGVQEETTFLGVRCLTARPNTERPITIIQGTNRLVSSRCDDLLQAVEASLRDQRPAPGRPEFWDGSTAGRIVEVMANL